MPLGVNSTSLTKVLKCAKDDTLKAADEADVLNLVYKPKSECVIFFPLLVGSLSLFSCGVVNSMLKLFLYRFGLHS